ncbi:MAG: hypothetical protein OHK0053_13650 [Microscillaceae bacterium]
MLSYIIWDVRPEIFAGYSVRWYGLLFALGFLIGQYIVAWMFRTERKPEKDLEKLMIYMVVATILGARLGHCLFYQPGYYLSNPIEILKIWEGGLASHGAAIGILLALYLYARNRPGQSFLWVVDRIVVVVALGGAFIRMGNLMNSEIIGKPGDQPWAFVFAYPLNESLQNYKELQFLRAEKIPATRPDTVVKGEVYVPLDLRLYFNARKIDEGSLKSFLNFNLASLLNQGETGKHYRLFENAPPYKLKLNEGEYRVEVALYALPRHPAQLYESLSCLALFFVLLGLYAWRKGRIPEGLFFGIFMIVIFGLRFVFEFLKENQVEWEDGRWLNQGQVLSIPAILIGLLALWYAARYRRTGPPALEVK